MSTTDIRCKFAFHPVGQGLFYSGVIKKYNFVYDCGTNSHKRYLENAISSYQCNKLDMLIISHFHKDHICGIKELFDKTGGAKNVIMPYLHPEEKYLLLANYVSKYKLDQNALENDEYVKFLQDPEAWFPNSVERIIYIVSDSDKKKETQERANSNTDEQFSWTENPHIEAGRIYRQNHDVILTSSYWYFKFYCNKSLITAQIIRDELQSLGIVIRDNEKGAFNIVFDELKKANDVYKHLFKNQNSTTLVCYHGPKIPPVNNTIELETMLFNNSVTDYLSLDKWLFHCVKNNCHYSSTRCIIFDGDMFWPGCRKDCKWVPLALGQMLTGDAELGKKEYEEHFKNELESVGIMLIPHHGSISNWRRWFNNIHQNCMVWVCSAGIGRKRHPHKEVVEDLINNKNTVILCNETAGFNICFRLHREPFR